MSPPSRTFCVYKEAPGFPPAAAPPYPQRYQSKTQPLYFATLMRSVPFPPPRACQKLLATSSTRVVNSRPLL